MGFSMRCPGDHIGRPTYKLETLFHFLLRAELWQMLLCLRAEKRRLSGVIKNSEEILRCLKPFFHQQKSQKHDKPVSFENNRTESGRHLNGKEPPSMEDTYVHYRYNNSLTFSDFISLREVKSRLKLVKALMLKQSSKSLP